ncbi:MAG: VTT domain-containing protein [Cyclobacteriaceae bacterium]
MKPDQQREAMERTRFFLKNLVRGLIWLGVIVGGYFYLKANYNFTMESMLGSLYDRPMVIFSIFFLSETVFGIIPPELFMIWALRNELILQYILNVSLLAGLSYVAGVIGYYIGSHFSTTQLYRTLQKNYLAKFEKHLNRFGGFLVVVAALTPLPFAGICMLMGTVKYPYRSFLYLATTRILRFVVYAMIIWETNILQ